MVDDSAQGSGGSGQRMRWDQVLAVRMAVPIAMGFWELR